MEGLCGRFGSCHRFGVAVGLRGYGMCQMRGASRSTIFLKMRRVVCIIFQSVPSFNFSKAKLSAKPFTCPRGKPLFENCRPFFFETQICPGPIATNVGAYFSLADQEPC
jgi:hypothetical protein